MNIVTDVYEMNARFQLMAMPGNFDQQHIRLQSGRLMHRLAKHLKQLGYHPQERSIISRSFPDDDVPGAVRIVATWSPDSTTGVYLMHGPCDGMSCPMPPTPTRIPPLAYQFQTSWDDQLFTYYRLGIDDDSNRWVYSFTEPDRHEETES